MTYIIIAVFGIVIGVLLMLLITKTKKKRVIREQSTVLLQRIEKVCKLVTTQGTFNQVHDYQDEKNIFFGMISSKKKALLIVNANVLVGFDLKQVRTNINPENKSIIISNLPEPKILSVDSDIRYYDKTEGRFNKFSENDLTQLSRQAKEKVRQKALDSDLFDKAKQEALDTLNVINEIATSFGWILSVDNNSIEHEETKHLK